MNSRVRDLSWFIVTAGVALFVLGISLADPGYNNYHRSRFPDVMTGTAHNPFAQRVLVPYLTRSIVFALPSTAHTAVEAAVAESELGDKAIRAFRLDRDFIAEHIVAMVIALCALIGFAVSVRALMAATIAAPPAFGCVVATVGLLGLPPLFKYQSYVYDFPALFLFTLGLFLMKTRRWRSYLLCFLVGCLNKETTVLLLVVYLLTHYRDLRAGRREAIALTVGQLGIFAITKTTLGILYRGNPGGLVEVWVLENLKLVFQRYSLSELLAWVFVGLLVYAHWQEKPVFLRRSLAIAVPLIILTFLFGIWDELRVYYEVYPAVLVLASFSVGRFLGLTVQSRES